jgi:peptide/nickel transport system permease protein
MAKFIFRRLLQSIPTLFGISVLTYALMLAAPGGPVAALTFGPNTTPQERARVAARLGVNDPFYLQYVRWLLGDDWLRWDSDGDGLADQAFLIPLDADGDGEPEPPGDRKGIVRGDFGRSFYQGRRQILPIIFERVAATLELGAAALAIGLSLGIPVGVLAAVNRGGLFDTISRVMAVVFNALPSFWLGLLLLLVFGGTGLGLLPMGNRCGVILLGGCPPFWLRLEYLVLPVFVIATGGIAGFSRFMRASLLDVSSQDYIRTARSRGLSERAVWFRHGVRNALIPIATFLGPAFTGILGGAAITETIFAWPGLGRLAVNSVTQKDYPIVMAVVMFAAVATILGYLLSDILYALIDPRIRLH